MDKKKLITASLASVAVLGLAFATSQPSVVKAEEETTAQNEFLANFDKALDETVKALEEDAKNNPESADQIKETIANLKAEAAKNRAEFEKGFKNGVTAEAAEKEVEKAAKAEEAAEEAEAQEEAAAQKEFLANFDKALEDAIAELKKADTQKDPELEKQVQDAITKLKEEAAKQKKEIEDGFKNGLTVEEAEKAIDDANKKAEEEAKAEAEEKAAQDEFLANYDKALEEAVKELEKAETNSPEEAKAKADTIAALKAASEQTRSAIVEGFKKGMTVEEAEKLIDQANEKAAAEDKEAAAKEKAAQDEFLSNYDKALEEAVKALEAAKTNSPEEVKAKADTIAALKAAAAQTRSEIVEGFKKGLTVKQAEALIDAANKKAAEEDKEAAAKEKAAQEEFLANYDKALEEAVKALEAAKTNSPEEVKAKADTIAALKAAAAQTRSEIVEGFKKGLTAKQAEVFIDELNKKAAEEDKEAQTNNRVESSNGQEAPINEVSEFDLSTLKEGITESKGNQNSRVPEKLPATPASQPGQEPAATPAESPAPAQAETATPAVAGTSQDNTYQAPAAKAEDKQELPNTGGKDNVAVASLGFLGLLLGALPFVKRKN